jgi:hypothetical protein
MGGNRWARGRKREREREVLDDQRSAAAIRRDSSSQQNELDKAGRGKPRTQGT